MGLSSEIRVKQKADGNIVHLVTGKRWTTLDENIKHLVERLKKKAYRPVPVKRKYINKPGTRMKRLLGIPDHEDKIVQHGITKILNAIYENDFLDCSFGFRPKRSCHDA